MGFSAGTETGGRPKGVGISRVWPMAFAGPAGSGSGVQAVVSIRLTVMVSTICTKKYLFTVLSSGIGLVQSYDASLRKDCQLIDIELQTISK